MILEFLEQIFSFYSADKDTDATVTCSGVVWSCSLVSRGTDVDLLSEFVTFMIAPSHKIGGTNTFNLGGTWYLMSWYRYQWPPLSPPSQHAKIWSLLRHFIDQSYRILAFSSTIDRNSRDSDCKHEKGQKNDVSLICLTLSENWCLACQNLVTFAPFYRSELQNTSFFKYNW